MSLSKKIAILTYVFFIFATFSLASKAKAATLSDMQGPAATAFNMSGEMGGAFIILTITFTLGALVGRMMAMPKSAADEPKNLRLPFEQEKSKRIGSPVHISTLTKQAAPPVPVVTPVLAIVQKKEEKPQERPAVAASPVRSPIILPAASPRPQIQPRPVQQQAARQPEERPKVRFNTSWSNPNRPHSQKPNAAPQN